MEKSSVRQLIITLVAAIAVLAMVAAASVLTGVSITNFTQDVTAIAGIHPLSGFLSNFGILLWCSTASVLAFVAATTRTRVATKDFLFLLASALVSAYLLFDDLFLFHEHLASQYFGISEKYIIAVLGMLGAAYLIVFNKIIFRTRFSFLISAVVFLTLSIVVDQVTFPWVWRLGNWWEFFVEDGLKWLGIACWFSYYVITAQQFLLEAVEMPGEGAGSTR